MAATLEQRLAPDYAFKIAGAMSGVLVLSAAGVSGGMPVLLLTVSVILAVRVYRCPPEAILAGPLFLLAASILLPSTARLDASASAGTTKELWQMYYWAAGLLIITCGVLLKVGYRVLLELPASLQAFHLVALVASVHGLAHGAQPSYVLRQLFGALLLGVYFGLALRGVDEESFVRGIGFWGLICALAFFAYYAVAFDKLGLHKETTTMGTQSTMLAILLVAGGSWKRKLAAGILMIVPLLIAMRRDLVGFALGVVLISALTARLKVLRWACWALAVVLVVGSLDPVYAGVALDYATGTTVFDKLLPEGSRDSTTVMERGVQLSEAYTVLRDSPVLGTGMGSSLEYNSGWLGRVYRPYIDNGWAYLFVKMGCLGVLAFGWFVIAMIWWMPGNSVRLSACLLSMLSLLMFVEPVFFNFTTSPLLGAIAGLLYRNRHNRSAKPQLV